MSSFNLRAFPYEGMILKADPMSVAPEATYNSEAAAVAGIKQRYPGCTFRETKLGADTQAVFVLVKRTDPNDPWMAYPEHTHPAQAFVEVTPATPLTPGLWA
jgi:hypothetical protein